MMFRFVSFLAVSLSLSLTAIAGGISAVPDWSQEGNVADAWYGGSVQGAGDVNGDGYADFLVGAPGFSPTPGNARGRAFLYLGSPIGASTSYAWMVEGQASGDKTGTVAAAGDVNGDGYSDVMIGSPGWNGTRGRVQVFFGSSQGLSTSEDWFFEGTDPGSFAGQAIATAGDVNGDGYSDILIGLQYETNTMTQQGRALLFLGSSSGPALLPVWDHLGTETRERFGAQVAPAGDVNGDGLSDFLVGSRREDVSFAGRASLFLGSATPASITASWSPTGNANDDLGFSLSTAGDANGDGYSDIAVCVPGIDTVQIYNGSGTGPSLTPSRSLSVPGVNYAYKAAAAGDVNGDGYADLIVGAQGTGRAYVYAGSATGLKTTPLWSRSDGEPSFGENVATAGDINGNGCSDLLIGAHLKDNGQTDEGKALRLSRRPQDVRQHFRGHLHGSPGREARVTDRQRG
ncbi:MAG: FG-GAP-like repeat-containing protein [Planctomycetota bacterium]